MRQADSTIGSSHSRSLLKKPRSSPVFIQQRQAAMTREGEKMRLTIVEVLDEFPVA
jgi:hypothetical protein